MIVDSGLLCSWDVSVGLEVVSIVFYEISRNGGRVVLKVV